MKINPESELAIQTDFFSWIDLHSAKFPELQLCFAIPNAAKRGKMDGWLMKLSGTRKGVPDVCLAHASKGTNIYGVKYHALYIEFKAIKGVVSIYQKEWHERLREAGNQVVICRSWVTAANEVIAYLGLPLERV